MIDRLAIEDFEKIIRYPLTAFLERYAQFVDSGQKRIYGYYSGTISEPDIDSFDELFDIKRELVKLNDLVELNKTRLREGRYWDVALLIEDINESIRTVENYSKWTRSSITKNNFNPNTEIEYITKQNETLESLSEQLGDLDPLNNWATIALRNNLREEDYGTNGGFRLSTSYRNKRSVDIVSVVDSIQGERLYGKDLSRVISFEDDDLKILTYQSTIQQSVDILASLRQGDNPEFNKGIQTSLVVGSNRASINYPILFRQFYESFASDDSLQKLSIVDVVNEGEALRIDFTIQTRLGEDINTQTSL